MAIRINDEGKELFDFYCEVSGEKRRFRWTSARVLKACLRDIEQGLKSEDEAENKIGFFDLLNEFERLNKKNRSWTWSGCAIKRHVEEYFREKGFAEKFAHDIKPLDVEQYLLEREINGKSKKEKGKGKGISGSAYNREVSFLKSLFRLALKREYVKTDPSKDLGRKKEEARKRYLSEGELNILIEKASSNLRVIIKFAVLTGLRTFSELGGLKWKDVQISDDVEKCFLRIEASKTESGVREVPLNSESKAILDEIKKARAEANIKTEADGFVFCEKFGGNVRRMPIGGFFTNFKKEWKRAVKESGLDNIRPYDLRKTFGSHVLQKHRDLQVVSQLLGHKNISVTAKHYAHVSSEYKQKAVASLAGLIKVSKDKDNGSFKAFFDGENQHEKSDFLQVLENERGYEKIKSEKI